ncbi:hypothetical protein E2542_SST06065 [Spatholobus suberectus]|nr:hypothetical protein E2542_SST06065 [Spatholobus suberectus]
MVVCYCRGVQIGDGISPPMGTASSMLRYKADIVRFSYKDQIKNLALLSSQGTLSLFDFTHVVDSTDFMSLIWYAFRTRCPQQRNTGLLESEAAQRVNKLQLEGREGRGDMTMVCTMRQPRIDILKTFDELTNEIIFGALKEEALVGTNYVVSLQLTLSGYLNLAPCDHKTWGAVFFECAGTCVVARYGNTCVGITYPDITWWPWNVFNSVSHLSNPRLYSLLC